MNDLQPGYAQKDENKKNGEKKKSYWESIGFSYLGGLNGQGDVDQLTQYAKVLNKRGEEAATVDYTNSQDFFKGLENLPTSTALEALRARKTWIDAMKQTSLYTLSNTMNKQLPFQGRMITGKTPDQFTPEIAERSNEFTSRYNESMEQYKVLDNLRIDFLEKVLNNKAISTAEAFKLFKLETGIDPTFQGELLTNDQKRSRITEGFDSLKNKGIYDNKSINFLQNAIPGYLKEPEYNQPIFPNKDVRIDPLKGTVQDRMNTKPYKSWQNKHAIPLQNHDGFPSVEQQLQDSIMRRQQPISHTLQSKRINEKFINENTQPTIHCDSLINIGSVTSADLSDINKFKDMLAEALLSLTQDLELA